MAQGTCYLPNGKVVAGGQASCQANGGTWVASGGTAPVQDDRNPLQKGLGWVAENPLKAAGYGLMGLGTGGLGWGAMAGGLGARFAGKHLLSKLGKSRVGRYWDKAFKKDKYTPVWPTPGAGVPKYPLMNAAQRRAIPTNPNLPVPTIASRVYDPRKLALAGGIGAGGLAVHKAGQPGREASAAANIANIEKNILASQAAFDATAKSEAEAKAEKERVANLGFFDRMKEPGYWDKSMSGDPNDTRLSRIAELTSYLGKTPKQRALETNPQDRWSEQAQSDATNQTALLKAQQTLSSPYGKPNVGDLADSLMNKVKEHFGNTWLPGDVMFGGKAKDEQLEAIANAVAIRITQLTKLAPNADPKLIEELAFKQIDEEGWKTATA